MIDYEKLTIELTKCIQIVNVDLNAALLHLSNERTDESFWCLSEAQRTLRRIEELFP